MLRRALVLLTCGMLFIVMSQLSPRSVAAQESPLPAPTGLYPVGVFSLTLIDGTREEVLTSDSGDSRAVTVFVWSPADVPEGTAPNLNLSGFDSEHSALAELIRLCCAARKDTATVIEQLDNLRGHAFQDVPIARAEAAYPVVIYSNILSGVPINQAAQLQELASHGYIVIDVIHTFGYVPDVSRFPILKLDGISIDYDAFEATASEDILFILDQLESMNANRPENRLSGYVNLDQIGVVGFSSGGWPVINAANEDSRIKAGISQDGDEPAVRWKGSQPFMFMASGAELDPNMRRDYLHAAGPAYLVQIEKFRHGDFSDAVVWPRQGYPPPQIDGRHAVEIVNAYVLAFFEQHLKGLDQPLLDGPSLSFPEATFESRNAD